MAAGAIARQLFRLIKKQMDKMIGGHRDTPMALLMEAMAREMPLRSMLMMGDGPLTREMLDALLILINGKVFKGSGALLRAIKNKATRK